jgi:hypothetical protein
MLIVQKIARRVFIIKLSEHSSRVSNYLLRRLFPAKIHAWFYTHRNNIHMKPIAVLKDTAATFYKAASLFIRTKPFVKRSTKFMNLRLRFFPRTVYPRLSPDSHSIIKFGNIKIAFVAHDDDDNSVKITVLALPTMNQPTALQRYHTLREFSMFSKSNSFGFIMVGLRLVMGW